MAAPRRQRCWTWGLVCVAVFSIFRGYKLLQNREPQDGQILNPDLPAILKSISKNGEIILMAGTGGYKNFIMNSVCRFQQLDIHNFVVLALDNGAKQFCIDRNISVITGEDLGSPVRYGASAHYLWSREFNLIARVKHVGALVCVKLGLRVLLTDVDVFFLENPLNHIAREQASFDFLFQSDSKPGDPPNYYVNSGLYYVRPTEAARKVLEELLVQTHSGRNQEQTVLHQLVCGALDEYRQGDLECSNANIGVKSKVMDKQKFANGFAVTRNPGAVEVLNNEPVTIHFNWLAGGVNKVVVMKGMGMWVIDDQLQCRATFDMHVTKKMARSVEELTVV